MSILENFVVNLSNPKEVREVQKKIRLLKAVFEKESISVNDLMKDLNMSFPTLNAVILESIDKGLLIQNERGESIGGRKPNLYQLNKGIFNVLCIEVNRFSIKLSLVDNNNNKLASSKDFKNSLPRGVDGLTDFVDLISLYTKENAIDWATISGVAILMPGLIDSEKGRNYSFFFEPGFELKEYLEDKLSKPVFIINDVKLVTYAEKYYGALKNVDNGLAILMDWGMALGIVANGENYMGKNGFSGEMGHINFVDDGELCYCGKRGCLETVASGVSLVNRARKDIENNVPTLLVKQYNSSNIQPIDIIETALEGDQYAIQLITDLGKHLGKAIALFV